MWDNPGNDFTVTCLHRTGHHKLIIGECFMIGIILHKNQVIKIITPTIIQR